jgi:hypothetical protein
MDGSWITDIATGGIDEKATKIMAYLVSKNYEAPLARGSFDLPAELEEHSLAKAEVERSP